MSRVFKPGARGTQWKQAIEAAREQYAAALAVGVYPPKQVLASTARRCIQDRKDVFGDCFCASFLDGQGAAPKDPLPDVMMEVRYGFDRDKWPETGVVQTGSGKKNNKRMWCNYGTTSVLPVPNTKALGVPVVFGQKGGFTARWLEADSKGALKLHVSPEFNSEQKMQAFVVWHCKQHNLPEAPTTLSSPAETLLAMAEEGKKRVAQEFKRTCEQTRSLTYETLQETLANVPDLAVRLLAMDDAQLSKSVAIMTASLQQMRALAAALKEAKYKYIAEKHDPLLRAVLDLEPRPMHWFKRNDPQAHEALAQPVVNVSSADRADALAKELKQQKRCTVRCIRDLERFAGDATVVVNELKKRHPDEHKVYMATVCAALAERTVEELLAARPEMRISILCGIARSDETTIGEFKAALKRSRADPVADMLARGYVSDADAGAWRSQAAVIQAALDKLQELISVVKCDAEVGAATEPAIVELTEQFRETLRISPTSATALAASIDKETRHKMVLYLERLKSLSKADDLDVCQGLLAGATKLVQRQTTYGLPVRFEGKDNSAGKDLEAMHLEAKAATADAVAKIKAESKTTLAAVETKEFKITATEVVDPLLNVVPASAFSGLDITSPAAAAGDSKASDFFGSSAGSLNDDEVAALQKLQLDEPTFDEPEEQDETAPAGDDDDFTLVGKHESATAGFVAYTPPATGTEFNYYTAQLDDKNKVKPRVVSVDMGVQHGLFMDNQKFDFDYSTPGVAKSKYSFEPKCICGDDQCAMLAEYKDSHLPWASKPKPEVKIAGTRVEEAVAGEVVHHPLVRLATGARECSCQDPECTKWRSEVAKPAGATSIGGKQDFVADEARGAKIAKDKQQTLEEFQQYLAKSNADGTTIDCYARTDVVHHHEVFSPQGERQCSCRVHNCKFLVSTSEAEPMKPTGAGAGVGFGIL